MGRDDTKLTEISGRLRKRAYSLAIVSAAYSVVKPEIEILPIKGILIEPPGGT